MNAHMCPQCGAKYATSEDSCAQRFAELLALDHSRQEPWGSRHGSAFSAYTLQHPAGQSRASLERCWTLLYRIWIAGDDPEFVARTLRDAESGRPPKWTVPPLPADAAGPWRPRVTIADLGTFEADRFPQQLEAWCRAALETLGQPSTSA
jgi:hypothetical protein